MLKLQACQSIYSYTTCVTNKIVSKYRSLCFGKIKVSHFSIPLPTYPIYEVTIWALRGLMEGCMPSKWLTKLSDVIKPKICIVKIARALKDSKGTIWSLCRLIVRCMCIKQVNIQTYNHTYLCRLNWRGALTIFRDNLVVYLWEPLV